MKASGGKLKMDICSFFIAKKKAGGADLVASSALNVSTCIKNGLMKKALDWIRFLNLMKIESFRSKCSLRPTSQRRASLWDYKEVNS